MSITTAAELKANLNKYLRLAATEDIYITQYGKVVAKLSNPFPDRTDGEMSLFDIPPGTKAYEEAREKKVASL